MPSFAYSSGHSSHQYSSIKVEHNVPTAAPNKHDYAPRIPSQQRNQKNRFRLGLISIFVIEYVGYIWLVLVPLLYPFPPSFLGLVLTLDFHFLFAMVLLCYLQCVRTDPGRIPRHWAFYRGDVAKRQRYCKECNAWKPERTHHCSSCARCVLNMDHHCPWVNNCIGFYNRRYFMQLLFYGTLGLGQVSCHGVSRLIRICWEQYAPYAQTPLPLPQHKFLLSAILLVLLTLFSGFFFLALTQFLCFHMRLIAKNSTTIENLSLHTMSPSKYDLGTLRNFEQVFGRGHYLWWLPFDTALTVPVGDGVRWV